MQFANITIYREGYVLDIMDVQCYTPTKIYSLQCEPKEWSDSCVQSTKQFSQFNSPSIKDTHFGLGKLVATNTTDANIANIDAIKIDYFYCTIFYANHR
ncbi:unnamed protein product [Caenorhabditis bovis]|uniref:Uncharacterized protein n=1 Tax=Caenorhabditis bovis TaxID=2654633 RepID=A0A8S1FC44_9PELO|nr:unnamed protein product [Caenorhabditis bovis]